MVINQRRFSVGAELIASGVHFRIWAPDKTRVQVVLEGEHTAMQWILSEEPGGYWSGFVDDIPAGSLYRFRLDDEEILYPDPASRFQPEGPHGPSQVVSSNFAWTDGEWKGIPEENRVIYEMHIGTFTQEGTYRAAIEELAELSRIGITIIEIMPLAEFDGKFGWGYDGVGLFAPYHHYGSPDDLRSFINEAHRLGMGVILDVVYNHCGSSGCYFRQFSKDYFSTAYKGDWGDVFNFDGHNSQPVRQFVCDNAAYWIREFHFDGFRLDATQQIFDASPRHIIQDLVADARAQANGRQLFIIAENEPQHSALVLPEAAEGYGLDGIVNDDFHHSAMVAMKGQREAYFHDYLGRPQEFISSVKYGFLFQGQWYAWQRQARGTPTFAVEQGAFIHFLQNHDQVANTGDGTRPDAKTHPGLYRAFTALLLLGPATPMLFQGQEFGASTPFCYFADHQGELAKLVANGRREFLHQFPSLASPEIQARLSRPDDPETFTRCKLNFAERRLHAHVYRMHKDLLTLRRLDPVFSRNALASIDGAILTDRSFLLRYFSQSGTEDRLVLINLGTDFPLTPVPEPLMAAPLHCRWQILWSSEHPTYGGRGIVPWRMDEKYVFPGCSALVLQAVATENVNDGNAA